MSGGALVLSPSKQLGHQAPHHPLVRAGTTPASQSSHRVTSLPSYTPPLLSRLPTTFLATPHSPPQPAFDEQTVGYTISQLPSIDPASLALHYALYRFRAVSQEYATLPYEEAFNWKDITLPVDVEREW